MWTHFFREGGWGMYPTLIFGLGLLAVALLCALRPERRFFRVVAWLAALTLASAVLGCTVGVITSIHYLHEVPLEKEFHFFALGLGESLNNVVLGLLLFIVGALLAAVGAVRAVRSEQLPAAP